MNLLTSMFTSTISCKIVKFMWALIFHTNKNTPKEWENIYIYIYSQFSYKVEQIDQCLQNICY